jgi:acetylornithine deacetylase/succinyl-diaminopimelate desuccinylase-like protein
MRVVSALLSAVAIFSIAAYGADVAANGDRPAATVEAAQRNFPEFLALLRIPNVAAEPADIQRNGAFLVESFRKRGFDAQLLDNAARRPLVFAQLGRPRAGARTVLFYAHFDGQPVTPTDWEQKTPFDPVVKARDSSGKWAPVDTARLTQQPFDPELRVFARSASDDKAPIIMLLTAVDMLKAQRRTPAINVKVLLDSEEEIGSPSLAEVVTANRKLFDADALIVLDGPQHASGRPTIVFGNRGITQAVLTVFGPRAPLHSGHFGNYAPNPAMRLASLLASMKDDQGRVLIPGYYDGIQLTAADRAVFEATGDDEAAIRARIGIARAESVGQSYQEALQYPSLNVRGMASAAVGARAANIVPSEAVAELDMRTTPEANGKHLFELVKQHIQKQGYHLVDASPTDEERARYDKLAMFELGDVEAAQRMPMDAPVGRWAYTALKTTPAARAGADPVRIRMMGGTVPTDVLVDALKLPFVLVPTVNGDNNQHAHDENLRMGHFISGTETILAMLTTPYPK